MNTAKDKQEAKKVGPVAVYGHICLNCEGVIPEYKEGKKFCNYRCKDEYHKKVVILGKKEIVKGSIHYARLNKSPRLQRLLRFLSDCKKHTTREVRAGSNIEGLTAAVSELRENGFNIVCEFKKTLEDGSKIYEYQLMKQ